MIRTLSALAIATAATALLIASGPAQATSFTFATYTFEQDYTPDTLALLGNGATLGGATFSAGTVTNITQSVAFVAASIGPGTTINPQAGFDPSRTLGRQANAQFGLLQTDNTSCVYGCAINVPNGNVGTTVRHGIQASWSGGGQLANGAGDDFVIYESASGSAITNREAYMVRLAFADGSYTPWRYEIVDTYENYLSSTEGATATAFDLSSFGVANGGLVAAIQLANLIAADKVDGATGFGNVNFAGVGFNPLTTASGVAFATGARDPDPLYIGILGTVQVVPVPAAVWLFGGALGLLGFARRRHAL